MSTPQLSSPLVIGGADVRRLLPMADCIERMAEALTTLAEGRALNPLRSGMRLRDGASIFGMMPGEMAEPATVGAKVVTVFPGNHGTAFDSHQGVVLLFETGHGAPYAIVDASEITAIRTAAVSGLATRLLARADARDLAVLGSGVQARSHLEAMLAVRELGSVRVCSPTVAHRDEFARWAGERFDVAVEPVASACAAVDGASLVCTTTAAREPVLSGAWLAAGAHVNAVGSSVATARELDAAALARARLFVDRRESTVNESGDYLAALREGAIDEDHIVGELGELLLGRVRGRERDDDVTLFKSLGLAVEDLAAAHAVYERACAEGAGTAVELAAGSP